MRPESCSSMRRASSVERGLPRILSIEDDHGVRGDDDGRADRTGGDEFGFGVGEAEDQVVRRFAGDGSFRR